MRRTHTKLWTDEEGGSVVEIALLSLLFFPIICYAAFFYDFSLASLKSLEASRYAAWELTAMQLWNWKGSSSNFKTQADIVSKEVTARWGDDLNGATSSDGSYLFDSSQKKYSGLAVTTLKQTNVSISDGFLGFLSEEGLSEGDMGNASAEENSAESVNFEEGDSSILSVLIEILNLVSGVADEIAKFAFDWLGFNTEGFAESQFSFELEFSKTAPVAVPIFSGALFNRSLFSSIPAKQKVLVDAWDLKESIDVDEGHNHSSIDDNGKSVDSDYYSQVGAVYLLGAPRKMEQLEDKIKEAIFGDLKNEVPDLSDLISDVFNFLGVHFPFDPVVRSYRMRGFKADGERLSPKIGNDCYYKTEACIDYDSGPNSTKDDDNVADPDEANSRRKFYTNVYKDTYVKKESPYYRVYKKLGGYYMGCGESQQKRCEFPQTVAE